LEEKQMAKKKATKYVYFFGGNKADGRADMKNLLGGKGANLAEMVNIGIPVPSGFTITTEVCTYYTENKKKYPQGLKETVEKALKKVENKWVQNLAIQKILYLFLSVVVRARQCLV